MKVMIGPDRRSTVWDFVETTRRFLVILAVGFWLGGFTFYAGVVIHTGHRVFGSARETGFLTQQVTNWLNISGACALLILLWNVLALRKQFGRWSRALLWLTWGLMVALQITLFLMHPALDQMLDVEAHRILDRARFHQLHKLYMNLSTAQWSAGLLHIWVALRAWRSSDRLGTPPSSTAGNATAK